MLSLIQTTWNQLSPIRLADGPPFFQERSSLIGLSILVHKLAVELKGKLQDSSPVSALYVKNSKALQKESMQHVSLSGERGGPTDVGGK